MIQKLTKYFQAAPLIEKVLLAVFTVGVLAAFTINTFQLITYHWQQAQPSEVELLGPKLNEKVNLENTNDYKTKLEESQKWMETAKKYEECLAKTESIPEGFERVSARLKCDAPAGYLSGAPSIPRKEVLLSDLCKDPPADLNLRQDQHETCQTYNEAFSTNSQQTTILAQMFPDPANPQEREKYNKTAKSREDILYFIPSYLLNGIELTGGALFLLYLIRAAVKLPAKK